MKKFAWLAPLLVVALLCACGKKEERAVAPEPKKVEKVAVEARQEAVAEVAVESIEELFRPEGEAGKEGALAGAAGTAEEAGQEVSKTLSTTSETMTGKAEEMAEPVTRTVTKTVVAAGGEVPESIVIENKKGAVTLPHKEHGAAFGCAICHGEGAPGPFELGKDKAHDLCKGCHKEKKGNAPRSCSGCHKK